MANKKVGRCRQVRGQPRSGEYARLIRASGNVPFQIKSSWCGVDNFLYEKDSLSDRKRGSQTKVIVVNAQLPRNDILLQFATSLVDFAGLIPDPRDIRVQDLLGRCFHDEIADAALKKMASVSTWQREADPILSNRVAQISRSGTIFSRRRNG
ncbi:hypothetical protein KBB12_01865 [Candidatus Woesebacteria bacterium]|nr:hypothetical protein [Candidatus Woesebacteria bacterium]